MDVMKFRWEIRNGISERSEMLTYFCTILRCVSGKKERGMVVLKLVAYNDESVNICSNAVTKG